MSNYTGPGYKAIKVGGLLKARALQATACVFRTRAHSRANFAGALDSSPSATRRASKTSSRHTNESHSRWTTKRWVNCLNCG